MRVLTFNLWHGLSPSTPLAFEALEPKARRELRETMQLETLKSISPDIAFLQEVNPIKQRAPLLEDALEAQSDTQLDLVGLKLLGVGLPLNLNSGLMTAVKDRWPLKRLEAISLSRPGFNLVKRWGSWQLREERFALFSETLLPHWGKVLLVNTHFHHGLEATPAYLSELEKAADQLELPASMVSELKERVMKGNERRAQELHVLMKKLDRLSQRHSVVLLAGDFNSTPDSAVAGALREHGFRDAWTEAGNSEPGFTFDPPANPANHILQAEFPLTLLIEDLSFSSKIRETLLGMARKHETRPRRIDFLWFRTRGLSLKVKKAELVGLPNGEGLAPSDHFGVCADFEV
jgi:endonuclease/exonuclease/phosphatase family metal-dependent hydrolase